MAAVNTGNLFEEVVDDFTEAAMGFLNPEQKREIRQTAKAAVEMCESAFDGDVNIPLNVYLEDSKKVWELAIPGKTKENVSVTAGQKDGKLAITIEVKATELSDEEKEKRAKRTNILQKIKGMNGIKFSAFIPESYDIESLKASVKDGLLTVSVSKKPEAQPRTFTVE
jgi:HSP20 family molecular chaperone IbpA